MDFNYFNRGAFLDDYINVNWWDLYDTIELDIATLEHKYFAVQQGGAKTLADTNNTTAGQFGGWAKMAVVRLDWMYKHGEEFTQDIYEQFLTMCQNTTVVFDIPEIGHQLETTLDECFGLHVPNTVQGIAVGDQVLARNVVAGKFDLEVPIELVANMPYSIIISDRAALGAGLDNKKLSVHMMGFRDGAR